MRSSKPPPSSSASALPPDPQSALNCGRDFGLVGNSFFARFGLKGGTGLAGGGSNCGTVAPPCGGGTKSPRSNTVSDMATVPPCGGGSSCPDFGGEEGCLKSSSTQHGGFIFCRLAMYWSPLKLVKTSQSSAPSDWARCKIRARLVSGWTMICLPSAAAAIKHSFFSPCAGGANDNVLAEQKLASDDGAVLTGVPGIRPECSAILPY